MRTLLVNVTFVRFEADDEAALLTMTHSDEFVNQAINAVRQVRFHQVPQQNRVVQVNQAEFALHHKQLGAETGSARRSNIMDFDGSATGRGVATIVGSHRPWWDAGPGCERDPDMGMWMCSLDPAADPALRNLMPEWLQDATLSTVDYARQLMPTEVAAGSACNSPQCS